jgi:enamine deaminase RidA (YjgF/YER057c/UK114 family)
MGSGGMSQAVVHGGFAFLAGQVAVDAPGAAVANQTRNILDRIDALLRSAGSERTKIPSATIRLADISTFAEDERGLGRLGAGGPRTGPRHRRGKARRAATCRRDRIVAEVG